MPDDSLPSGTPATNRFPEFPADVRFDMLIGGDWVPAVSGETFTCTDPYDDRQWGRIPAAGSVDVDRAVRAAREAFPSWASTPPTHRARILSRWGSLIESHNEELARLQVHENGKTLAEMRGATSSLVGDAAYFGALAEAPHGYTAESAIPHHQLWTRREPIGVVAAITPWNNPLGLLSWKLFPALAAGNTLVVKPSEVTPASTLLLARLGMEAGLPAGVLNVVTGFGDPAGIALTRHPGVDKIAFTGSTAAGRAIAHAAVDRMARVTLELGGKSPQIVFADADLDRAVGGLLTGITAGTGQACNAGSRILIEAPVYDEVVDRLVEAVAGLRLGDPLDPGTQMGPLASRPQLEKVLHYFGVAEQDGHKLLTGGRRPAGAPELARGFFVEPTLYGEVPNTARLAREEIFGPVGAVIRFEGEDEAVRLANDSDYGLVAGIWSENLSRVHRTVPRLRSGTVWINTWRVIHHQAPFGGVKQSGLGRELGFDALQAYTENKSVWMNVPA